MRSVKVVNVSDVDDSAMNIYIGRTFMSIQKIRSYIDGSILHNPHKITNEVPREEAILRYEKHFYDNLDKFKGILDFIEENARKRTVCLVCWCAPQSCHGDIIAKYINDKIAGPEAEIESESLFE